MVDKVRNGGWHGQNWKGMVTNGEASQKFEGPDKCASMERDGEVTARERVGAEAVLHIDHLLVEFHDSTFPGMGLSWEQVGDEW